MGAGIMSKEDEIWMSQAFGNSKLIKFFVSNRSLEDPKKATVAFKANKAGVPLEQDQFPEEIYGKYRDQKYTKLPDMCCAGAWIVSERMADVLRQFDLGQGALYPVRVLEYDRKTQVEGRYFHINVGNVKEAFLPEMSPTAQRRHDGIDIWKRIVPAKNDEMAVRDTALTGPDIWIDPRFYNAFFLSGRLVRALKAAKLTRGLWLSRCRVIKDN